MKTLCDVITGMNCENCPFEKVCATHDQCFMFYNKGDAESVLKEMKKRIEDALNKF